MTNKVRDLVCGAIMLAFGIGMFVLAMGIPHKIESDVGSGYVPKFIAGCIIVVAVVQLVLTFVRKSPSDQVKEKVFDDAAGGILTIVLMAAYMMIFQPVGFICSSAIYLFAQIMLLSDKTNRNPLLFAAVAILLPVAVDALFVFVIKMPLPKGIIGF
ncbi:MAG: tripartite tricarboxylate transporter TctB family protein [Clostridiales bacterium]|nr:tripartite tricarboxylate transporter TctB family protein [Clostridiales bacterium]